MSKEMKKEKSQVNVERIMKSNTRKMKKGRIIIVGVCVLALCVGTVVFTKTNNAQEEVTTVSKETTVTKGDLTVGITESGNTVLGTLSTYYTLEESSSSGSSSSSQSASMMGGSSTSTSGTGSTTMPTLIVEEVYVAVSDQVEVGDKILKVTEESYDALLAYLEASVTTAELNLKQAEINRTLAETNAKNDYNTNTSAASIAKEVYNNTLTKLENSVTTAKKELADAKATISELKSNINNDTYYTDYNISTLKKAITTSEKSIASITTKLEKAQQEGKDTMELQSQLESAERELESAQNAYDQAYEKYEQALASAKEQLAKQESSLPNIQLSYDEAVTNQKKGKLDAEATYEAALVTANNADTLYDIDVDGIDEEVNTAMDNVTAAKETLEEFKLIFTEYTIVSEYAGMVTALGFEAEDELTTSTAVVTIADSSLVTVSVSVDQEDIASIAVNDIVNIAFTAYPNITYNALVTSISTTPSSDNSSTVTYPVTVTLTGDVSAVYSGMSVDVTFVTKEMKDVLYVSNKAIITEGTKSYVKRQDTEGTVTKIEVTIGFSDGNNVEVLSGLGEGDIVLIESQVKAN